MATVCRCCLAAGAACKALTGAYDWMGEREVYADMLLDSFDIKIAEKPGDGICDVCVGRLRDAVGFKRQVLRSQRLYQQLEPDRVEPKEEVVTSEDGDAGGSDVDDDDDKDMLPLSTYAREPKVIFNAKNKATHGQPSNCAAVGKLRTKGAVRSRKKTNIDLVKKGSSVRLKVGSQTIKPLRIGSRNICEQLIAPVTSASQEFFSQLPCVPERIKQKVNCTVLIRFSNATPFKGKKMDGYVCFFCTKSFLDPEMLRIHVKRDHESNRRSYFANLTSEESHVKVDITDLMCLECSHGIQDISSLKKHLATVHNKRIFDDVGDKMLPFRLNKDLPLKCITCDQSFEAYKTLHQHMNVHFRNFVCATCDAGFVTLRRLKMHEARHVDGAHRCETCAKTFRSTEKLNSHMKGVHMGMWAKYKCAECREKFTSYEKRQKHLVEVHSATPVVYRCQACDRGFDTKKTLTKHTKKVHLQMKDYACGSCEMRFFTNTQLKEHTLKHTRVRAFGCAVCRKTYGRRTTLREHMRIHADERRFACGACGVTFVQKCTLKVHVNAHHGGVDADKLILILANVKSSRLKTIVGSTSIKPLSGETSSDDVSSEEDETVKQTSSKIVNGGTPATPSLEQLNAMPERVKVNVNTSAVVKFSNVTPFKSKVHDGYICFYCIRVFPDPSDLRGHTAAEHETEKLDFFQRLKGMGERDVKLDITGLRCTICSQAMSDLNALKDHLVTAHDKKLFRDLGENTLPFKLTKEGPLHCALCSQPFETYRTLHLHMNTHFRNHVCAQCGAGFVTQRRLRFHESRHRAGAYRCEACGKTFQSRVKLNGHRRGVHEGLWKRNKCPHCPERFTDYYKKQQHLVEAHNEPRIEYRCGACSKEFTNKTRLTNHTKKYHLQEVHFECSVCAQKFFARRELRRHMARHAANSAALPCNPKAAPCDVCHRTLSTKASLKEHMLTHVGTLKSAVILKNDVDPPHPTDIALE